MNYYQSLESSYQAIADKKNNLADFDPSDLRQSRDLFEFNQFGDPCPRKLDVVALVSGIPFDTATTLYLQGQQKLLRGLLSSSKYYFVLPANFGLELAVAKWPNDSYNKSIIDEITLFFDHQNAIGPIQIQLRGFQIHRDGCVVVKGFDKDARFTTLRQSILKSIPSMPIRQSGWVHIPLGRILEPIGPHNFLRLKSAELLSQEFGHTCFVDLVKLVFEHRWYMVDKTITHTFPF